MQVHNAARTTYFNPCATSASLALFPATTTRLSVSKASILPPCHPIAFISKGTTCRKKNTNSKDKESRVNKGQNK